MTQHTDDPVTHLKRELAGVKYYSPSEMKRLRRQEAYAALLESVTPMIWSIALEQVNVRGWTVEPTDLFQAACVRVLEALPEYNPSTASLTTFAHVTALNAMRNYLRDELRQTEQLQSIHDHGVDASVEDIMDYLSTVNEAAEADSTVDDLDMAEAIDSGMKQLPERQRQAMQLRIDGHNVATIGKVMDISHQAVGNLLRKGVAKLKSAVYS